MNNSPTTEDRTWAVLSHLSSLAFGMGILLPIVGWSDRRRKSNYGAFQSLQALGYQSLGFTIWVLSYLVIAVIGSIILLIVLGPEDSGNSEAIATPWLIGFSIVLAGFLVLYLLLPIVAAIACALGKDFRYPILGDRLARYLGYGSSSNSEEQTWLIEDHEFRWVAAMGHISILIMIWGMLAPLTTWILYGKRSLFLKFQSIQTLVYQAVVTVFYFFGTALYLAGIFTLVISMNQWNPGDSSSLNIVGIIVFAGLLLCGGVIILVIPLLHILGQWAGYRVLKGDDYRYPWVGRLVDKRISKTSVSEEKPA